MDTEKARVLDPHEEEGLKLIYSEIIKTFYQTPKSEKVSKREVRLQIYTKQTGEHLEKFQLEIVDDADIFFHYLFKLDEDRYQDYQEEKELGDDVEFNKFLDLTSKYIEGSQKDTENYRILFSIQEEGPAHLILSKKLKLKFADVFNFDMEVVPRSTTRRCVQARFNQMRKDLINTESTLLNQRLNVKERSPALARSLDATIDKINVA